MIMEDWKMPAGMKAFRDLLLAIDRDERAGSIGGVPWHEAPQPRRFHFCQPQTSAWIGIEQVQRCACGAIRNPGISFRWMERNSRRKGEREARLQAWLRETGRV